MYLKRIEVKGFKSFADKVDLEFGIGITAIVGPNGSGKSNISDAIRWVLGEQSAKTLRGAKMEDIIFIGTESRKSLGYAEVSLTIDNESGMLPLGFTEITVTRRLYRSGESEYLINNNTCRLKDIVEMFMDTGIGKEGYSLIGQGKIDEILSTKSEDRRNLFEEAAGIVKYKTRKLESEKKLENTRQNLIRVMDIIQELQEQIEPLREQSQVARKYLSLKEELKGLEISVILCNFEAVKKKLDKAVSDIEELSESKSSFENNKQKVLLEIQNLKTNINSIESEYDKTNNYRFETEKSLENRQGSIKLLEERKENFIKEKERLNREIEDQSQSIKNIDIEIDSIEIEKINIQDELVKSKNSIDNINSEYETVNQKCMEFDRAIDSKKSDLIQILKDISDLNNRISSSGMMIENLNNRKSQLIKDTAADHESLKTLCMEIEKVEGSILEINREINCWRGEFEKSSLTSAEMESNQLKLVNQRNSSFDKLKTCEARYNTLSIMEKEMEGFNRAVKSVITKYKDNRSVFGVISDLIQVPKGYETAVEIALGPSIQNIVTDNEHTASDIISFLKRNNLGRATFLPLTTIRGREASVDKGTQNLTGYLGIASNIIKFDTRFEKAISNLLGRVIICDNLNNARVIAKKIDYSCRVVTLEGDVINTGGSFTGGSINSKGAGVLSRKSELDELNELINGEKIVLEGIEHDLEDISREIQNNKSLMNDINVKIQDFTISIQTEQNKILGLRREQKGHEEDIKDMEIEITQIDKELESSRSYMSTNDSKLKDLGKRQGDIEEELNKNQVEYRTLQSCKEEIWNSITKERITFAEISKSLESINLNLGKLQSEKASYRQRIANYQTALLENEGKIQDTIRNIEAGTEEINGIIKNIETIKSMLGELEERRRELSVDIEHMEKEQVRLEESLNNVVTSIHKLEISKSKLEAETEMLVNKLWEEYELSIPQAEKYKIVLSNISEANRKVNELKNNIRSLGDVNVNSIEEFKRVTERHDFLQSQREDLLRAEESLLEIIQEITRKMETQFEEKFRVIRENFNYTFKELFGGGYADLRLEGDDVLNSGIEIIVQPPGKKLQSLSLLSGGERGLAAIALVFAILKMKPTPFCVLDEIEAALDDANVNRFAKFLSLYAENTQFIMITHRKGSMAVADTLYGVTMEEKGVSKMISLKLKEEERYGMV